MIPAWFNVTNYDCAATWTEKDWAHAVSTRMMVSESTMPFEKDRYVFTLAIVFELDSRYSTAPFIDTWNAIVKEMHCNPIGVKNRNFFYQRYKRTVSSLTVAELVLLYKKATEGISAEDIDYLRGDTIEPPSEDTIEFFWQTVEERNVEMGRWSNSRDKSINVNINLNMPKSLILKQLSAEIDASREKYDIHYLTKPPSTFDFRRWHEMKVLAYHDLLLLAKINSVALTNEQIGTYLFPDEFNVGLADRVRKVIKPLSDILFQEETCAALCIAAGTK